MSTTLVILIQAVLDIPSAPLRLIPVEIFKMAENQELSSALDKVQLPILFASMRMVTKIEQG